jgi:hypothetical protein
LEEVIMPKYFFDVKNRRRITDAVGLDCIDDLGAIATAKFHASRISIEVPVYEGPRHVIVLNDAGTEIYQALVSSGTITTLQRSGFL